MPHYSSVSFIDNNSEPSRSTIHHGALTPASLAGFLTEWGTLRAAMAACSLCTARKEKIVLDDTVLSNAVPTDDYAKRELKLRVDYTGDTFGRWYSVTIPGPDLANMTKEANSDFIDLTAGTVIPAFIAAFETTARTPIDDTETVTVQRIEVVGRNL